MILAYFCITTAIVGVTAADRDAGWLLSPELGDRGYAARPGTLPMQITGTKSYDPAERGGGLILDGKTTELVLAARAADVRGHLPTMAMTAGAWVSIDIPRRWGGIIGCVRDDGDLEKGWVLGYDDHRFTFALSTTGADDGNGLLTYVAGEQHPYEVGRWHHVAATYDGVECRLFVDGEPAARSAEQTGDILYDLDAPFVIGAYRDANEHHRHDGRLLEVRLLDRALTPAEIRTWYGERAELSRIAPWVDTKLEWLVDPYLTWPTTEAMTVSFETTVATDATLECWHESGDDRRTETSPRPAQLHHFRLTGLRPNEKYFYRVAARDSKGAELEGELLSFRTAVTPDRSFTFVAIGDTQSQADVAKRVSDLAYMHRPNLVVHAGDLVDTGTVKVDWTGHFFPAMQPLIGRVPLMPVLGNHEQDAQHYYDYMDLPAPESYYAFTFGDAEFFMIDGNRKLAPGSEQLAWLDRSLRASTSKWKFAVLHQPPYTSDSDDYGNTFETTSRRGDPNVQNIVALLEKYGVDICFSGHVHDYERTFPIRDGRVTSYEDGGVVYVTTAGGGGHLENFDPNNTWFGHKKARYHHLVYVAVNGDHLEFQAIDEHGRLFDVFELRKTAGRRVRVSHADTVEGPHEHGHSPWTEVNVFGVRVLASSSVPDDKLLHVAKVLAEYLDNDEDGAPDNSAVVAAMVQRRAFLVMSKTEDELWRFADAIPDGHGQDLYADETHPGGAARGVFDASYEEVLHLVTSAGYASVYPEAFGERPGSRIAMAMDVARGGRFRRVPAEYPAEAWYTYDDRSCDYACQVTEYFYWALTSLLGAQSFEGRLDDIGHEWRLNTRERLRLGDPAVFDLLTDPEYRLPTRLPDGVYDAIRFVILRP